MVREGATRTPASSAASSQDPPSQADQALHHFPVSMRVQSPSVVATEKIRGKKLLLNAVDELVDDFGGPVRTDFFPARKRVMSSTDPVNDPRR